MAFVLTTGADIECSASGKVQLSGSHKLKVSGQSVITPDDVNHKTISGCTIANSNSTKQCTTVTSASGGSPKLKVDGTAVAIDSLTGSSDGTTPAISVKSAGQSKLKG